VKTGPGRVLAVVLPLLLFAPAIERGPLATRVGESAVTSSAQLRPGELVLAATAGAPGWRLRARVWTRDGWSRTLPVREALDRARARAWRRGRGGLRVIRVKTPLLFAGTASWYGYELAGHQTACGEAFDPEGLTAASRDWPCDTWLVVRHNGRDVLVRVNDYGPAASSGHVLDLSLGAFRRLADPDAGVIDVEVRRP
jgi:hypothetical protein